MADALQERNFQSHALSSSGAAGNEMPFVTLCTSAGRLLADEQRHGRFYKASEKFFDFILNVYRHSLAWVLDNSALVLLIFLITLGFNIYLYVVVPKGCFPQQDTGRMNGIFMARGSRSSADRAR